MRFVAVSCLAVFAGLVLLSTWVLVDSYLRSRTWDGVTCCAPLDDITFFWTTLLIGLSGLVLAISNSRSRW